MKVKVDRQVVVTLVMNGEEAAWLMKTMNVSMITVARGDNHIIHETPRDTCFRQAFYQQLHKELDT